MDDCYIPSVVQVAHNVDYLDNSIAYNHNTLSLLRCHRLTGDARLKNVCWRRTLKNLNKLPEINPFAINWDKQSDITWLYGPQMPSDDEDTMPAHTDECPDLETDQGSLCSWSSYGSEDDDGMRKSSLKRPDAVAHPKRVSFDYKIASREIINGLAFDYYLLAEEH
ncbi:hypothetical protein DICA1_A02278 [Diutina catenulata]